MQNKKKIILGIIFVLFLIIVTITICLQNKNKEMKLDEFTSIEYGVYVSNPKEGETFVPSITLNSDNTYEFRPSQRIKYNGDYHIAHNRIILTINEGQAYNLGKSGQKLILIDNIDNCLNSGTEFNIWGTLD